MNGNVADGNVAKRAVDPVLSKTWSVENAAKRVGDRVLRPPPSPYRSSQHAQGGAETLVCHFSTPPSHVHILYTEAYGLSLSHDHQPVKIAFVRS